MKTTRRMLIATAWVVLVSFVALTAATYAWMSIATFYKVSDIDVNIITENAMEIALDVNGAPGEWVKSLASQDFVPADTALRPVTWSAKDKAFYAPNYGLDGRIDFFGSYLVTQVSTDDPTPSANQAEEEEGAGYLVAVDLWFRTGAAKVSTYLSGPDISGEGEEMGNGTFVMGAPVWDAEQICHVNGGKGAENVVRIGFLTYDYYSADGALYQEGSFYIYEPNTSLEEETFNTDGQPLHTGGKLIKQGTSTFSELEEVLHGSVNYERGEFISEDAEMFDLLANIPRKVTLFVWLEGQDDHCNNSISAGQILANLQIGATTKNNQPGIGRPEGGGEE